MKTSLGLGNLEMGIPVWTVKSTSCTGHPWPITFVETLTCAFLYSTSFFTYRSKSAYNVCIRYISLAVWITEDTAAWFLPGNSAALSCNLPHPQSWLQVKLPQSEEQRTPVGDNKGVTHLHSCGKVSALRYTVVQENVTPYTWLWHWRRALSLCQWNGSSLEVLTTFRIFWWNRSPQFFYQRQACIDF